MAVEVVNGGGGANLQSKEVSPTYANIRDGFTVEPDIGKDGFSSVTINGDSKFRSYNIKKGVTIFDVTGVAATYTLSNITTSSLSIVTEGNWKYLKITDSDITSSTKLLGMLVLFKYSQNGSGSYIGAVSGFATDEDETVALVCGSDDSTESQYGGWARSKCIVRDGYFLVRLTPLLDDAGSATLEILSYAGPKRIVFS